MFNGLKLAITFAVVGATVGEFVAADKGFGYQIMAATLILDKRRHRFSLLSNYRKFQHGLLNWT